MGKKRKGVVCAKLNMLVLDMLGGIICVVLVGNYNERIGKRKLTHVL
jgi:hypothetical protein